MTLSNTSLRLHVEIPEMAALERESSGGGENGKDIVLREGFVSAPLPPAMSPERSRKRN
jgi:hypothetical protein